MPYGYSALAPHVEAAFREANPASVLDVGAGYGFWGAFLRTYFCGREDGRLAKPFPWLLNGVEGFRNYQNPMWDLYDSMTLANIEEIGIGLQCARHDFVVCIDVMEHLSVRAGTEILRETKSGIFGICLAMYDGPIAPFGNRLESHITLWDKDVLRQTPGLTVTELNPLYLMVTKGL